MKGQYSVFACLVKCLMFLVKLSLEISHKTQITLERALSLTRITKHLVTNVLSSQSFTETYLSPVRCTWWSNKIPIIEHRKPQRINRNDIGDLQPPH